jgi:tRNA(Ile)-lysidine synthase TilS/MesJ
VPFDFSLMALHVNPGFEPESHKLLAGWLEKNGIAAHLEVTDHGMRAHTDENCTSSPCFFCAMHRRKRLFELCRDYNLTHLAFGHTADDLVASFFMNLCQNGRVEGMSMREPFFGGKILVIRPADASGEKNDHQSGKGLETAHMEKRVPFGR